MLNPRKIFKPIFALFLIAFLTAPQAAALAGQKASASGAVASEPNGKFELTIDNIMRGPGLVGYEPRAVRWSADSQRIYFQWKRVDEPREKDFDTYVVGRDGAGLKKLTEEEAKNAPPTGGELSKDKKLTLFTEDGDLFIYDHASGQRRQITRTTDVETNARFTRDQRRVYFTRSNNLFVLSLDTGSLVQMTDIRAAGAAPSTAGTGSGGQFGGGQQARAAASAQRGTDSQEFIKKEERDLLDVVKRRAEKREADEQKRKRDNPRKPFQLAPRQSVVSLQLTPDESAVIATVIEAGEGAKNTIVPNYVTETAYSEDIPSRTKVGDSQSRSRLAALSVASGDVKWVDHGQKQVAPRTETRTERTTGETAVRSDATQTQQQSAAQTAERREGQTDAARAAAEQRERDVQLFQPLWSEDGTKAVMLARSADNKDRWILALDPATGKTRPIVTLHDDAWIDGPGAFTIGWMRDNQHIYFQSERDGYAHLYTVSFDGGEPRQLTSGKWEVTGVQMSDDKTRFFLTTSEVHPGERHLYMMSEGGGERTKITSSPGNNQAFVSPDERALALIYSYSNRPPEIYVQEMRAGASAVKVTSSPAPEFWNYKWIEPEIVTFTARDGASVYARLYKPKTFKRGGPAVIFVHGAGYLQNVHRWWSNYFREYMFHHLLMENGYMVIDVDYRASAGYGRDWRTGIYRHMGGKDLQDHVDAARWLVSAHGVDPKRIGIYGGSYGGFITLMALFTEPDVFAAGAALRPVTDWAHYNHPYTSNILNTPQRDTEAYKRSSPIYFAQNLKGALLICHGMVDTNVHFQDSVRLVQRLIELRKENWELAVYPVEDHGFVEPTSWADEYKRIFKLFSRLHPDSESTQRKQANAKQRQ
ncbi:MAG TPA: prolyl oligopeptidase family serine peptidase [Blastocatellia bacterium]|nr:prolyl oligopeptidase family serine peptidase [Blastocatellia bacterium]